MLGNHFPNLLSLTTSATHPRASVLSLLTDRESLEQAFQEPALGLGFKMGAESSRVQFICGGLVEHGGPEKGRAGIRLGPTFCSSCRAFCLRSSIWFQASS